MRKPPTARRQAIRLGALYGRKLASYYLSGNFHTGEINRIRKRLKRKEDADYIFSSYYILPLLGKWRVVAVRSFQRTAMNILVRATQSER